MNKENLPDQKIIFIDSECVLCNGFSEFVIKRDNKKKFKFSTINKIEQEISNDTKQGTIIYYDSEEFYYKSTAVLKILRQLNSPLKILWVLKYIPSTIRNLIYSIISTNRYKIFGKTKKCVIKSQKDRKAEF